MNPSDNKPVIERPQVKVCGLMDPEPAAACVEMGADAIGLIFFPKSPRNLTPDRAREVGRAVTPHAALVGVFVDEGYDRVMAVAERAGLTGVQLHGAEPPDLVQRLRENGLTVVKALFATRAPGFDAVSNYAPDAFLVECGKGPLPGGNAMAWDHGAARGISGETPLVLAGGLDPENVADAIKAAQPDAVDVSSGVEVSPGIKDLEKVRRFLEVVRTAERRGPVRRVF